MNNLTVNAPLHEILRAGSDLLQKRKIRRPLWIAEQLLAHHLRCLPIELYLEAPPIQHKQAVRFQSDIAAHSNGVPFQYLLGTGSFYGRDFFVGPGVFIPRPETEVLVESALDFCNAEKLLRNESISVLEVGTGSGAIAITLVLEQPSLDVEAIDLSFHALFYARRNARRHGSSVLFHSGDLLDSREPASADLIVANLPYMDPKTSGEWPRELFWEPWMALDGGNQGIFLIQKLIRQAVKVLRPQGRIILEIGMGQVEAMTSAVLSSGFSIEQVVQDLSGMDRVVVLKQR